MKQSVVWFIACCLIFWAWVYAFLFSWSQSLSFPSLFTWSQGFALERVVPWSYDQILYLRVDNDLREVALQSNQLVDAQSFASLIDTLEELVVFQKVDYDALQSYSLIFMQWNEGFSINQIEAFGLLAWDEWFDSRNLWGNKWVYGDLASLAWYDAYVSDILRDDAWWMWFKKAFKKANYNAWFLSTSVSPESNNLLLHQFADALQYTFAVSALSLNRPLWKVVLQFAEQTVSSSVSQFTSSLVSRLTDTSLLYVEMQNILSILSIDQQELSLLLPALLWQWWPSIGVWFENADVERLIDVLRWNIWFVVVPSLSSPVQVWAYLILDNPEVYDTLLKFAPALTNLWWSLLFQPWDQVDIISESTHNRVQYAIEMWWLFDFDQDDEAWELLWLTQEDRELFWSLPTRYPLLGMEQLSDSVVVSLFTEDSLPLNWNFTDHYPIHNDTKALFWFDAWLISQTFWWDVANASDVLFADWSLQWSLRVDAGAQQVILEFVVQ